MMRKVKKKKSVYIDQKYRTVARLLIMGAPLNQIAKEIKMSHDGVRQMVRRESFQKVRKQMEEELFSSSTTKFNRLLDSGIGMFSREMKHLLRQKTLNPKDRAYALDLMDRVFRLHGKYVDKTEEVNKTPAMGIVMNNPNLTLTEGASQALMKILSLPPGKEVTVEEVTTIGKKGKD